MGFFTKLFGGSSEARPDRLRPEDVGMVQVMGQPLMLIEDRFGITGRGVIITGTLLQDIAVEQPVEVILPSGEPHQGTFKIKGIEASGATQQRARAGVTLGVLIGQPPAVTDTIISMS